MENDYSFSVVNQVSMKIYEDMDDLLFQTVKQIDNGEHIEITISKKKTLLAIARAIPQYVHRRKENGTIRVSCPVCGNNLMPSDNFCSCCGQMVNWRTDK